MENLGGMSPEAHPVFVSRRRAFAMMAASAVTVSRARAESGEHRRIDVKLSEEFQDSGERNVLAVVSSVAHAIWKHCPRTVWTMPGFWVFRSSDGPITLHRHRADGRIAIGLTARKYFWSQYAFQFAHEFCHALAGHSNDWHAAWLGNHGASQWFEESLCETASLFALQALSADWARNPPFEKWREYAPRLSEYVCDRLATAAARLPDASRFREWFDGQLGSLRESGSQREKNLVVARELLPVFERCPGGWESVTFLNRVTDRDPRKSFAKQLRDWERACPEEHRPFASGIAALFPYDAAERV
jgi:hypothetical protein